MKVFSNRKTGLVLIAAWFLSVGCQSVRQTTDDETMRSRTSPSPSQESSAFAPVPTPAVPAGEYLVIDLSGGLETPSFPVSHLAEAPSGGWGDEYKTYKLVLRRIPAGSFKMGSPGGELGRHENEDLHEVELSEPFYIGVFEVTCRQWELVTGKTAVHLRNPGTLMAPVSNVSYEMVRGSDKGAKWPASDTVDDVSFLGLLRDKSGIRFDLPTEAQWEYACRAGTSTALNNGKNLSHEAADPALAAVGRFCQVPDPNEPGTWRFSADVIKVGSLAPNGWGLYDMHGNVMEWCLDWYRPHLGTAAVSGPRGGPAAPDTTRGPDDSRGTSTRVLRGGCAHDYALECRSAARVHDFENAKDSGGIANYGFRLACPGN